ncbi:hypothetical protein KIN20_014089 [Parelaphostrongylus tenuis]|uniref:Uncharacterized protein n=1 Tax=Parelaphostrongylus tenuis TaxID=148309 RepID=A0AAD5QLG0_PARTN|nr:hypothetical protein KIN20_014089 [Parelaphostrongylus tenuis]
MAKRQFGMRKMAGGQGDEQQIISVLDALESQGSSTLMPDGVISDISSQLDINITYEPMLCQKVHLDLTKDTVDEKTPQNCIIVGNTVTEICDSIADWQMLCDTQTGVKAVPNKHLLISGTLSIQFPFPFTIFFRKEKEILVDNKHHHG